jgi:Fe-S cluster biosynthesis and repair protein YggX
LEKAPFRNPLGEKIHGAICQNCWADWLEHQTVLINHHGLDPRTPHARNFLYEQIETVLLKGEGGEEIDTSQKGTIQY